MDQIDDIYIDRAIDKNEFEQIAELSESKPSKQQTNITNNSTKYTYKHNNIDCLNFEDVEIAMSEYNPSNKPKQVAESNRMNKCEASKHMNIDDICELYIVPDDKSESVEPNQQIESRYYNVSATSTEGEKGIDEEKSKNDSPRRSPRKVVRRTETSRLPHIQGVQQVLTGGETEPKRGSSGNKYKTSRCIKTHKTRRGENSKWKRDKKLKLFNHALKLGRRENRKARYYQCSLKPLRLHKVSGGQELSTATREEATQGAKNNKRKRQLSIALFMKHAKNNKVRQKRWKGYNAKLKNEYMKKYKQWRQRGMAIRKVGTKLNI